MKKYKPRRYTVRKVFLLCVTASLLSGCAGRLSKVRAKAWRFAERRDYFPERDDPVLAVPEIKRRYEEGKETFGVAFSGGGTRSASATLGQLRAMHNLGWLEEAHYISAVSGGSWASVPYIYLPYGHCDARFLGRYKAPEDLSDRDFNDTQSGSLADAICSSGLLWPFLKSWVPWPEGDETYAYMIGDVFLEPFGLNEKDRFFTFQEAALADILNDNNTCKDNDNYLTRDDFYLVRKGRPYLIVGGTLQRTPDSISDATAHSDNIYPFEMTPLYLGIPSHFSPTDEERGIIGGGYLESFGYDSKAPPQLSEGRIQLELGAERHIFTLSDMIGTSGAAPQETLTGAARYLTLGLSTALGFPEFRHWPIDGNVSVTELNYSHGDGGNIDNLGLLALLSRKVDNIIVFINTQTDFDPQPDGRITTKVMVDDLIYYFRKSARRPYIRVFKEEELGVLYEAFKEKKEADLPLVVCREYKKEAFAEDYNKRFNVTPYDVKVCWVYLDRTRKWIRAVKANPKAPDNGAKLGAHPRVDPYKNFPHYRTFGQQLSDDQLELIDLSEKEVNALAHLSSWTVCDCASEIADFFDNGISGGPCASDPSQ